jgi:hypothetical protein
VLSVTGYIVIGQLKLASETAFRLTGDEIIEKIRIKTDESYRLLKRFPDSEAEFETLVLGKLDFSRYPLHITVQNFLPGNRLMPASFRIIIDGKATTIPLLLRIQYYGSEYQMNLRLKGKILLI